MIMTLVLFIIENTVEQQFILAVMFKILWGDTHTNERDFERIIILNEVLSITSGDLCELGRCGRRRV